MDRPIWLTGFMASGKSTVGRAVAEALGVPFVDLDGEIERAAGARVPDVFAREGEAGFRAREREIATAWLGDATPRVVAAGGGTLVDAEVRRLAMDRALVVALHVRLADVLGRIGAGPGRPMATSPEALADLFRARAGVYGIAHAGVWNVGRPLSAVAGEVVAYARGTAIPVSVGPRSHPVHVERGSFGSIGERVLGWSPRGPVALVVDRGVPRGIRAKAMMRLGKAGLAPIPMPVPPGDGSKSIRMATRLWDRMLEAGFSRRDPVVAVGGGMATDLAGFVASTALRGMPVFHVPTTVLAQLDAAIGGKTALNHATGKNRIGTFHMPRLVLADPDVLSSLPDRDRIAGLAEAVKCGLSIEPALLDLCERRAEALRLGDGEVLEEAIRLAARAKARIVAEDERETGEGPLPGRPVLNLGHTVGHALEAAGGFETLLHGEAVARGLVAAARLSVALAGAPADLPARVSAVLSALGLPSEVGVLDDVAVRFLSADKKAEGDRVRLVLLRGIGEPVLIEVPVGEVVRLLS
jgi:shikimate kinase/3-dehydroquinate synthase